MTTTSDKTKAETADPWAEAAEACVAATNLYAETMQACWMAGAGAMMDSLQSSLDALPVADDPETDPKASGASTRDDRPANQSVAAPPATAKSWYRRPVENPLLSMVDDVMKPWRTMMPDYSGHHSRDLSEADLFTPKGAAEIMAAYQSGSGFSMAQISFPDEKSICLTLPAPWAMLTKP